VVSASQVTCPMTKKNYICDTHNPQQNSISTDGTDRLGKSHHNKSCHGENAELQILLVTTWIMVNRRGPEPATPAYPHNRAAGECGKQEQEQRAFGVVSSVSGQSIWFPV